MEQTVRQSNNQNHLSLETERGTGSLAAPKRVALLMDTSADGSRGIISGIQNYGLRNGAWQLYVEPRFDKLMRMPALWRGDGVIAQVSNAAGARQLQVLGLPVVNVSNIALDGVGYPQVRNHLEVSSRMAAKYFLRRGFRHYAYFSLQMTGQVTVHQQAFSAALANRGHFFGTYTAQAGRAGKPCGNLDLKALGKWLKMLPKPVGVLTWDFNSARELFGACQMAKLLVPEQIAILSGTDDELLSLSLPVQMSGITIASEEIGYQAAALLDQMMGGNKLPSEPVLVAPMGIKTRHSTDTFPVQNKMVAKAMRFIRENATRDIRVNDVARAVDRSRTILDRRFKRVFGRSPAEELREMRFEHAKQLLEKTDLSIPEVAAAVSFDAAYLLRFIVKRTGLTPLRYRRQFRRQRRILAETELGAQ